MKRSNSNSDPFSVALRLLTSRDRSEAELFQRLKAKGYSPEEIHRSIERCRELGYVDDLRFARQRCRELLRSGRAVGNRLIMELLRHGVQETVAKTAADEIEEEFNQETILAELIKKRFSNFDFQEAGDKEKRRLVSYFQRRGFNLSLILSHLRQF